MTTGPITVDDTDLTCETIGGVEIGAGSSVCPVDDNEMDAAVKDKSQKMSEKEK